MKIFKKLDSKIRSNKSAEDIKTEIKDLKLDIDEFYEYVKSTGVNVLDRFGGPFIRRVEMAEFLIYNTDIMLFSIEQGKRIPDNRKELPTRDWW